MKELKVSELIELLQRVDQDSLVVLEGCDCYGETVGISESWPNTIMIRRADGSYRGDFDIITLEGVTEK